MDLTPEEIFLLVDKFVFITFVICLTILAFIMYNVVRKYFESIASMQSYEEQKNLISQELEILEKALEHILDKYKIESFEMFQNTIKASEKRIKDYIDGITKKNTDEN